MTIAAIPAARWHHVHTVGHAMTPATIKTIPQIAAAGPFSEHTVRWWIQHANSNGFAPCILRIGRRVYIDEAKFAEWLESHRAAA